MSSIAVAQALVPIAPEFFENLTNEERLALVYFHDLWLRPDQRIPGGNWVYYGFICGRGFGKTLGTACEVNRRVECGEAKSVGLMAPTEDRVDEVQVANLIAEAPPWFKPERYRDGLIWPNGVQAEIHSAESPGRTRSSNFDLTWLTEIVDWQASTRWEAFKNITTATRVGTHPQVIWDTTSKGVNDVILHLVKLNEEDPEAYPIQHGAMFDNPMLPREYLKTECRKYTGRAFDEEVLGKVFREVGGASFKQTWLDDSRVDARPARPRRTLVAVDPALSTREDADETGIVVGDEGQDGDAYVHTDLTGRYEPEEWGDLVIDQCVRGAAGVVIERNHLGNNAVYVLRSRATLKDLRVEMVKKDEPIPPRKNGVVWVREVNAATSKVDRAEGPASETEAGFVHMVGKLLTKLENQLITFVPGPNVKSPNNFDAYNYLVTELRNLNHTKPQDPGAGVRESAAIAKELRLRLAARPRRGL